MSEPEYYENLNDRLASSTECLSEVECAAITELELAEQRKRLAWEQVEIAQRNVATAMDIWLERCAELRALKGGV